MLQDLHDLPGAEKKNKTFVHSLHNILKNLDSLSEELKQLQRKEEAEQDTPLSSESAPEQGQELQELEGSIDRASEEPLREEETKQESREESNQEIEANKEESNQQEHKEEDTKEKNESSPENKEVDNQSKVEVDDQGVKEDASQKEEEVIKPVSKEDTVADDNKDEEKAQTEEQPSTDGEPNQEEKTRIEREKESGILKIRNVADNVDKLKGQIRGFFVDTSGLNLEELEQQPENCKRPSLMPVNEL